MKNIERLINELQSELGIIFKEKELPVVRIAILRGYSDGYSEATKEAINVMNNKNK